MHKCLKCKKKYSDEEVPIVEGCSCGSRLFLYTKGKKIPKISEEVESEIFEKIEKLDKKKKEEETEEGEETEKPDALKKDKKTEGFRREKGIQFGVETIRIKDTGIYEININALMRGRPMIVLSKGGSYVISLPSAFGREDDEEEDLDI